MNLNPQTKAGRQNLARAAAFVTVFTMLAMLLGMPALTPTAHAMSPGWPSNEDEVRSQFNVVNEDGCLSVNREGQYGFEVHGNHFRISPGSSSLIVILHLNPGHYSWQSQQAEPHGDNGVGGEKWYVPQGQEVTLDVNGDCNTGLSLYPLAPQQSSVPAASQPVAYQPPVSQTMSFQPGGVPAGPPPLRGYNGPSAGGMQGCPVDDLGMLMDLLGKNRADAQYWVWLPNEKNPDGSVKPENARMFNGYKYRNGKGDSFTVPSGFGGAHIDWWDRFQPGTSWEGESTPNIVEGTVWLTRCNP